LVFLLPEELDDDEALEVASAAACVATCVTTMAEITIFFAFSRTAGGRSAPILFKELKTLDKPSNSAPTIGTSATGLVPYSLGGIILGLVGTYP